MLDSCTLRNSLVKGQGPSLGYWQTLPGANVSRILARAGAEWVVVDCEHGNIDGERKSLVELDGTMKKSGRGC
jgi:4-hydroxy-2-oxoheptanedioate aldolase